MLVVTLLNRTLCVLTRDAEMLRVRGKEGDGHPIKRKTNEKNKKEKKKRLQTATPP